MGTRTITMGRVGTCTRIERVWSALMRGVFS
jgi:hypothetical protein